MFRLLPFLGLICAIHGATVQKFVTGTVTFNGPKDIQAGSRVQIQLQDVSLMDTAAKIVGTITITDAKSFPISYKVGYDPSEVKRGFRYSMSARITGPDGQLHYINDMHISADVTGSNGPTVDIPVIKVGGPPVDSKKITGAKNCPAVNCRGKSKSCPYGYEKNKAGCDICKCLDPCNPPGKPILCGSKQRCFVDRNTDGTFSARCGAPDTHKDKKDDKDSKEACREPKKAGMCLAAITRFYYNSATKRCESFIYGGCGANKNNFESKIACERFCKA